MNEYDYICLRNRERVDGFCDMVDEVEQGGPDFAITKNGQPVAVVVEYDAYRTMQDALRELSDRD